MKRECKVPKGTRDFHPNQMLVRNQVINQIKGVFKKHGAVEIDTPVFELKETLLGQYQEGEKLIYDLQDQGGELLSLRYDLTVPFCRYMAQYGKQRLKRFHIAKVYRREAVSHNIGRYREFYQCDFDIAGNYDPMIADAECVKIFHEILNELQLGTGFQIKVNNRKILDCILEVAGVGNSVELFKSVCSSVDKLDKEPWESVCKELLGQGLKQDQCNVIKQFVTKRDNYRAIIDFLQNEPRLSKVTKSKEAIEEMVLLFQYLEDFDCVQNITFDLSLARGLGYYTGLIFEAIYKSEDCSVGSIVGGGRYDNMISEFSGGKQVGAVGGSVGIQRIFDIFEQRKSKEQVGRNNQTQVYIATVSNLTSEKLKLAAQLWSHGIQTEFAYKNQCKPQPQLDDILENGIPYQIWIGPDEIKGDFVILQNTATRDQRQIPRQNLIQELKQILNK